MTEEFAFLCNFNDISKVIGKKLPTVYRYHDRIMLNSPLNMYITSIHKWKAIKQFIKINEFLNNRKFLFYQKNSDTFLNH